MTVVLVRRALVLVLTSLAFWSGAVVEAQAPAAGTENENVVTDVVYGHKDGMALTFDVFSPTGPANGVGILYMVSSGWISRWTPPAFMRRAFEELLEAGFTVFAVRHGSRPRFHVPDAVADVVRAVRFVRRHADTYGVDPARLGAFGESAGGHLALMLGLDRDSGIPDANDEVLRVASGVSAVVAYFPLVDLRPINPEERLLEFDVELAPSISPILFASADDPPTLLIHGDADDLVPMSNSESMHAALQAAGAVSELVVIAGLGHGFRRPSNRERAQRLMVNWFETHLLRR